MESAANMIHQEYREFEMTTEIKERINHTTAKTTAKTAAAHSVRLRSWIHCPRCIGGNMYLDTNGEFVCIQCGCSCFPEAVTKIPAGTKESLNTENNLFTDISNALRTQRSVHS
jgi:hypothetical protein